MYFLPGGGPGRKLDYNQEVSWRTTDTINISCFFTVFFYFRNFSRILGIIAATGICCESLNYNQPPPCARYQGLCCHGDSYWTRVVRRICGFKTEEREGLSSSCRFQGDPWTGGLRWDGCRPCFCSSAWGLFPPPLVPEVPPKRLVSVRLVEYSPGRSYPDQVCGWDWGRPGYTHPCYPQQPQPSALRIAGCTGLDFLNGPNLKSLRFLI